jgi:lactoylglutathione lyase
LFAQIDYLVVGVSDMQRSIRFYRDVLGLSLSSESEDWTEFQTGKTKLALHITSKKGVSTGGDIVAGTSQISFEVPDIDKIYRELQAKGVRFVMAPQAREGEGIKLAKCLDPDGFTISIRERTSPTHMHEVAVAQ